MAQSTQPRFTIEEIYHMKAHLLSMNVQTEGLDPTGDEKVLRNRLIKKLYPNHDLNVKTTTRNLRSNPTIDIDETAPNIEINVIPPTQPEISNSVNNNRKSKSKTKEKVTLPKTWSRTLIQNATIPKLEKALTELGLSTECQTTKR